MSPLTRRMSPSRQSVMAHCGEAASSSGEAGEEEIGATDNGCEVTVGAADGDEVRHGCAFVVEEEAEERRRAARAEVAAEVGVGTDSSAKGAAGEGGTEEAREGREAEEDLAEEIVVERNTVVRSGGCGCGDSWEAMAFTGNARNGMMLPVF